MQREYAFCSERKSAEGCVETDTQWRSKVIVLESSWNVMAHGDAREGKVKEKLANGVGSQYPSLSITTADTHTSAASSRLNWSPCRFKWTRPFRRKTKSGFCACAITFQTQSTTGPTSAVCYAQPMTSRIRPPCHPSSLGHTVLYPPSRTSARLPHCKRKTRNVFNWKWSLLCFHTSTILNLQ
jgi:hypothetical protein